MQFPVNWKTTAGGVGAMLIPIVDQMIPILPPNMVPYASILSLALGLMFAKDNNVTGGSVKQ